MQMLCLCVESSRTSGLLSKTEQAVQWKLSKMSALLINKQNVGVQSCCQLLQDHLCRHPPPPALQSTTVMLLFGFTIPPLLSMQGCVHSSVGSGEQGPALTLRSWDSTGLKRGIMGELRRARRKSGIVPPDDCVCVCVWPTSCLVKVESHCWFNSRSCLLLSGTHIWTVHSSVFTRVVPCTSCWPVCAASIVAMCALSLRSSAYFWEVTSQTEALLIWDPESITITSGGFGEGGGLRLPHA